MSDRIIKPPTSGEHDDVDMWAICEAVGLPTKYATPQVTRSYIFPCVQSTFSDGELTVTHAPTGDPTIQEHFGTTRCDEGSFGQRLRQLFDSGDIAMRHQADKLIRIAAAVLAVDVIQGNVLLPEHQNVSVQASESSPEQIARIALRGINLTGDTTYPALLFDNQRVELAVAPQAVVDYGPGLKGRFHIDQQIADWQSGNPQYAYLALGKGPFINEFLQQYWAEQLGDNQKLFSNVIGNLYIGREDGMAAASTEFAAAQLQHTGSTECADIVVASGIHTAGHDEVGTSIANAYKLLKPDGVLLIRAPKAGYLETSTSVAAETMVKMALKAGFNSNKARPTNIMIDNDAGTPIIGLSAIFRK